MHSNIFCTAIFVLGQDVSQGTTTKNSGWPKVKLPLAGQESISHFTQNTDTVLHKRIISVLHIDIYSTLVYSRLYTIHDISD